MDIFENLVMWHLTTRPDVFVRHQHVIRSGSANEWSCPDFVALDFGQRRALVVEVSTEANSRSLVDKVRNREAHWINSLKAQLRAARVIDEANWGFEVHVYVRKDREQEFSALTDSPGTPLHVRVFEDLGAPWTWET